ncbi:MAG: DUF2207 domain-containing protein [Ruminococcaceae bacterium]|nr:DUF2207 domain-containing protein [Oscillospiraceae bacterium]
MRKCIVYILLLATLGCLALPVLAAPQASQFTNDTVFLEDGSCNVRITMTVLVEENVDTILVPWPAQVDGVTVSSSGRYEVTEEGALFSVSGAGSHELSLRYTLDGLVTKDKNGATLTLPLLSGLHYPISNLTFTVTLPSHVDSQPVLESGYYQQNVENILEYSFDGKTLTGQSKTALKDRETLVMTLELPKDYFKTAARRFALPDGWDLAMLLLILAAVAYFLLTLMPKFPGRARRTTAPDEIHAGDVGTCLTGCGTDLTMLVLSWAQLGYILIEIDKKNRVTLHKRMDMGNERDSHEVRWFKSLFGQRTMVDADSYHYAKLCRKLAAKSPLRGRLYDKKSGNPVIFRAMCCVVGIVAGLQMGLGMSVSTGVKTLLATTFACLCGVFSYFIQSGGKCLPLREKTPLWTALACSGIWIALGGLAGDLQQAVPMVVFQFIAGVAAAYGGKRSEMGVKYLQQIRGLRRHMCTATTFDLQQLQQKNPNYFYELAPFALTLGVDKLFARRFGKIVLPEDGYLQCQDAREMTPVRFAARLRKAADVLNQRQKRLPYEQLRGK